MREGDVDHLIYYALQSTAFTDLPRIEPALGSTESAVAARLDAFLKAVQRPGGNARLRYFREVLERERPERTSWRTFLSEQYARAAAFLRRQALGTSDTLYQRRGLSTDTSVDAGYVVYLALGALRQLEPARRIRRALVVGPGLDLAPRTGLVELGDPQAVQPFAVIDALLGLGLADADALRMATVDINPRVVDWLRAVRNSTVRLDLVSGVEENERVKVTDDYRTYFAGLGKAIQQAPAVQAPAPGRLSKTIAVRAAVTDLVEPTILDVTVNRLNDRFDLVVVTNVLPYLSDTELLLALDNVVAMLAPHGVLVHNEPRPLVAEALLALDLPLIHSRSAVIATVEGAKTPIYDAVWMHRR